MTRIRLPYIHRFLDRHGQARYHVRRAGRKRVALKGLPGSEEFMSAYQAALADLKPPEIGAKRTKPGTINATVIAYYASTSFTADFSASTRAMRRAILERFRVEHGDKRIALLHQDHVARLLDKMKPSAQRNWLKTLRGLMRFAVAQRLRGDDPTRGIELRRVARTGGHLTWGDSEIAKYRNAHDLGTVARVALELMLNVAARPGDACQLGRQHITKDGRLSWHPNKTRRSTRQAVTVRILPELKSALDAMRPSAALTFLTNDYGKPFASAAAFGNKFAEWCRKAGIEGVIGDDHQLRNFRAHGLRKAACVRLAEAGCTAPEIMAVSGHRTLGQVQIYIEEANRKRMAEAAMDKLSETETATTSGKPSDPKWQTVS